ncbi:MAG TPA: hypothetical protein VHY37_11210 [Tepidisphaeraceae bacterium]|jgi:hypothetical protein|nr:hypothetical protein [Tepidisphaeraceae bacterium]
MSKRAPRNAVPADLSASSSVPAPDRKPVIEPLESRTLLSASTTIIEPNVLISPNASTGTTIEGYTPAEMKAAYGLTSSGTGAGETIAIVDAYNDPNLASDLGTFDSAFGLPSANLKVVSQSGGSSLPANNAGWDTEISLDVEWAHAIAPGANILLVEASSSSLTNLLDAVNYARDAAGVSVVSMSWGGSEFNGETSYDSDFTTPAGHQGVTFVASAGDDPGTEWPAVSPDVLSVGGTTLELSSTGAYESETPWSDGGGGYSPLEKEPSYQDDAQTTGERSDPDVAWDANPNTGVAVYDSVSYEGYVGWQEYGGTSVGAPSWSGLIAIADQARGSAGTLNGVNQTLPILYTLYSGGASSSTYTSSFNDVGGSSTTAGGRGFGGRGFGGGGTTTTTLGYNTQTGLGSPKGSDIVSALVAGKITTTTAATTTTSTGGNTHGVPLLGRNRGRLVQLLSDPQSVALAALSQANASAAFVSSATRASAAAVGSAAVLADSATAAGPSFDTVGAPSSAAPIGIASPAASGTAPVGSNGVAALMTAALPTPSATLTAAPLAIEPIAPPSARPAASQAFAIAWSLAPAALRWYQAPLQQFAGKRPAMAATVVLGAAAIAYAVSTSRKNEERRASAAIFSESRICAR